MSTFIKTALVLLLISFSFASVAQAEIRGIIPEECTGKQLQNECNLNSVEQTLANVANLIVSVTGSLALLSFVIGGLMYILSGGNQKKVAKATDVLKYSFIGMMIIMLAGVAIRFLLKYLGGN